MKRAYSYVAYLISTVFVCVCVSGAQVATGTPPFSSLGGGPFDVVNLGNLNLHFAVPVIHKAGRGMSFDYDLSYDGSIWTPVTSSGTTSWQPASNWGWRGQTEASVGYVVQSSKLRTVASWRNSAVVGWAFV
ncbi:MAG: hypothetical protein DMG76_25595 [Acidobacteria bacterium]|nr:MAG: hypothetical protein DMG76_25595 [Acidobacteriota bacterium]